MSFNDGPAERQSHPHSIGLRSVERLEDALQIFRINARPGIAHYHENLFRPDLLGADRQLSCLSLNSVHCLDRVQDQVQKDLLQLNTIPLNGGQLLRKMGMERDCMLGHCASRQSNRLVDHFVKIKAMLLRRRFLDVITDPFDDVSGAIGIADDTAERFPDLAQVWWLFV